MALPGHVSRIVELANIISNATSKIQADLSEEQLFSLSVTSDYTPIPDSLQAHRNAILDATLELYDTLLDPLSLIFQYGGHNNMVSLQAISRFKIAEKVPREGCISFEDLSRLTEVNKSFLKRVLRPAIARHIFEEPEPGMLAHTSASRALLGPHMNDWLTVATEEMWAPATKLLDASQKWPNSQEPHESGFSLANNSTKSAYSIISADATRATRFAGAMSAYTSSPEFSIDHTLTMYDWASLGTAQVVDVGGSQGHVALALAERYPNLSIRVQDTEEVVTKAKGLVPKDLGSRVSFEVHDLFAPQGLKADVFFLRWILHNWSDKYCLQILRALIPGLKQGGRVLIQDTLLPEPGQVPRSANLNMMAAFNSHERTAEEWRELIKAVDDRLEVAEVYFSPKSALAIFEVVWKG